MTTETSLSDYIAEQGGAVSLPDAADYLDVPIGIVREWYSELEIAPRVGRIGCVTTALANELEAYIEEATGDADDEDEDDDDDEDDEANE